MEENIGFKELYEVSLKATYPIEIGNRKIEVGETVAAFDRIQIATFDETKNYISANGGFDNRAWVWWEESRQAQISFTQGTFSKDQLSVMMGSKLITNDGASKVAVNGREVVETDAGGIAKLKHKIKEPLFVYNKETGERITGISFHDDVIVTNYRYQELLVDYYYEYDNGYSVLTCGRELMTGYLSLEGKTRVKDDITGQVTTGIIKIPKLKLLSNLSMRLGQDAIPILGRVDAVAVPTGERGHKKIMEIIFLNDDVDSDM